jgi:hypothetical protein
MVFDHGGNMAQGGIGSGKWGRKFRARMARGTKILIISYVSVVTQKKAAHQREQDTRKKI